MENLNKIYIFDDLIPENYQNYLENLIKKDIPFYLGNVSSAGMEDTSKFYNLQDKIYDRPQMVHSLVHRNMDGTKGYSSYYNFISPLFYHIQSNFNFTFNFEILRSKINLKHQSPLEYESKFNPPHIDRTPFIPNSWVLIYYVHDSDGDTIIFNEKYNPLKENTNFSIHTTISPKKGRIAFFPANVFHSANCPTKNINRIIINTIMTISSV